MTSCGRPTLADLAMCDALHAWATAHGTEAAAFEDPLEAYLHRCAACAACADARCASCCVVAKRVEAVREADRTSRDAMVGVRAELISRLRCSGVLEDRLPREAPLEEARRWKARLGRRLNGVLCPPDRPAFRASEGVDAWAIRLRRQYIVERGQRGAAARRFYNQLTHATPAQRRLRAEERGAPSTPKRRAASEEVDGTSPTATRRRVSSV